LATVKPFSPVATPSAHVTFPSPKADVAGDRAPGTLRTLNFDAVYEAYAQTVARWAARLGGPGVDAEDITQEVFVVVDRRLREFRHDSQVATWLFSITAKIVANDRRRRRIRRWWLRLMPNAGHDRPAATDSPLEQLERRERRRHFYEALDGLGERQRRMLVLFELEGLPIAEIAELTGLRAGNVRVLLHRARAAFLKRMTERELSESLARPAAGPTEERE
jgi:RNA polymerase sigma-70 factor (ECF subfamily)